MRKEKYNVREDAKKKYRRYQDTMDTIEKGDILMATDRDSFEMVKWYNEELIEIKGLIGDVKDMSERLGLDKVFTNEALVALNFLKGEIKGRIYRAYINLDFDED